MSPPGLTVAVTGPTGTFGSGLLPLLQDDERVARVIGIARRPFDPAERGWTKMDYRQGDVRDPDALRTAFDGADVVVHLAFLITGNAPRQTIRAINVDGTLNTFRAAADAGARRFVYASSVAAYGFGIDIPERIDEDWPARPAARLFYARRRPSSKGCSRPRPVPTAPPSCTSCARPSCWGRTRSAARTCCPVRSPRWAGGCSAGPAGCPFRLPLLVPEHPLQLVHEEDVGRALLLCVVGAGPPGAYNIAGDGRADRRRRRPRVRRPAHPAARRTDPGGRPRGGPPAAACRRSPNGSRRPAGR